MHDIDVGPLPNDLPEEVHRRIASAFVLLTNINDRDYSKVKKRNHKYNSLLFYHSIACYDFEFEVMENRNLNDHCVPFKLISKVSKGYDLRYFSILMYFLLGKDVPDYYDPMIFSLKKDSPYLDVMAEIDKEIKRKRKSNET